MPDVEWLAVVRLDLFVLGLRMGRLHDVADGRPVGHDPRRSAQLDAVGFQESLCVTIRHHHLKHEGHRHSPTNVKSKHRRSP